MKEERKGIEKFNYELLGCLNCRFADQKAIKKNRPCCTHWLGPLTRADGSCLMSKKKSEIQIRFFLADDE